MLFAGAPRNEITAKIDNTDCGGCSIIMVAGPIHIKKSRQGSGARAFEKKTMVDGSFEVVKETLQSLPMNVRWLMHELR